MGNYSFELLQSDNYCNQFVTFLVYYTDPNTP